MDSGGRLGSLEGDCYRAAVGGVRVLLPAAVGGRRRGPQPRGGGGGQGREALERLQEAAEDRQHQRAMALAPPARLTVPGLPRRFLPSTSGGKSSLCITTTFIRSSRFHRFFETLCGLVGGWARYCWWGARAWIGGRFMSGISSMV